MNGLQHVVGAHAIKWNEPLHPYTFTKTGGVADALVFPSTYEEVQAVVRYAHETGTPLTYLGNGSNLIIRDGGIRGIVLSLLSLNKMASHGSIITAQSGASLIEVSRYALKRKLDGLTFACGIPGTVGGAVYMNAGAYGGEIKDVLKDVLVVTTEGELIRLKKEDLTLQYRHTSIAEEGHLVLDARFELSEGDPATIQNEMERLTHLRTSKQPLEYPSCGSVFKRPPNRFAGKLIQDSGLQGVRIGGVEVSTKHAGFMVNVGGGTASDYIALIEHVQQTVKDTFGVSLETEVAIIGEHENPHR